MYNNVLVSGKKRGIDYKVINELQWNFLHSRYSGLPIKRDKKLLFSLSQTDIELLKINLVVLPVRDEFKREKVSVPKALYANNEWSLKKLIDQIVKVLNGRKYNYNLKAKKIRLWKLTERLAFEQVLSLLDKDKEKIVLEDIDNNEINTGVEFPGICLNSLTMKELFDFNLEESTLIFLEQANNKDEFIFKCPKSIKEGICSYCSNKSYLITSCGCNRLFYCSWSCKNKDKKYNTHGCDIKKESINEVKVKPNLQMGLTGIRNLGNTCYINSGLQCLSHTWELTRYFLEDWHLSEVSKKPDSSKFTLAYANLIKSLWYGNESHVNPHDMKNEIWKRHKAFVGTVHQDSQELISVILDSLNEDLNRAKQKSNIDKIPVEEDMKNWYNHLSKNQSIIVDLTHGDLKTTIFCPNCKRQSINYEIFQILSLPLPKDNPKPISILYVPYNISLPITKCTFVIEKDDLISVLRERMSQLLKVSNSSFVLASMSVDTLNQFVSNESTIRYVNNLAVKHDAELFAFEINSELMKGIMPNELIKASISFYKEVSYESRLFIPQERVPFTRIVYLEKSWSLEKLHLKVLKYLRPLLYKTSTIPIEELFAQLFPNLNDSNYKHALSSLNNYPYTLRLKTANCKKDGKRICVYCSKEDCENCPVPLSRNKRVNDLVKVNPNREVLELVVEFSNKSTLPDLELLSKITEPPNYNEALNFKDKSMELTDCFELFGREEELDAKNLWECSYCHKKVHARTKTQFLKLPPILILHLKRFKLRPHLQSVPNRINVQVNFPLENLDLSAYINSPSPIYDLYAVSNHYGTTGSGHYTAFAYNWHAKNWFLFDDQTIRKINKNEVCSKAAYVLFYRRRDLKDGINYKSIKQTLPSEYKILNGTNKEVVNLIQDKKRYLNELD